MRQKISGSLRAARESPDHAFDHVADCCLLLGDPGVRLQARPGKLTVDVATHAERKVLYFIGDLCLAFSPQPLRVCRQNRQRSLQAMRQIGGARLCTLNSLCLCVEQRIDLGDERHDFFWFVDRDSLLLARTNGIHASPESFQRPEPDSDLPPGCNQQNPSQDCEGPE